MLATEVNYLFAGGSCKLHELYFSAANSFNVQRERERQGEREKKKEGRKGGRPETDRLSKENYRWRAFI